MNSARIIKIIKDVTKKLGYRINKIDEFVYFDFESLLQSYLNKHGSMSFIQIGASDGVRADPIHEFVVRNHKRVKGIVVEPLDIPFSELKKNYEKYPNIVAVNVAIHNSEKEMIMYFVNPLTKEAVPIWAKGIASFNGNHHKLSGISSEVMVSQKVSCVSLRKLVEDYGVKNIDLLQIDTEGYDAEIILNIDFSFIKPKIIHYEHDLPQKVMSKETFLKIADRLHMNGYELIIEHYDVTAYQRDIFLDMLGS